jgi:hypothetical protein
MKKLMLAALVLAFASIPLLDAEATAKKTRSASFPLPNAEAAAKKTSSRSDYSKAQQEKFFKEALALCRNKFPGLVRTKVDYRRKRFVCYYR